MLIYLGSDHRGFKLKESLKKFLQKKGYKVIDCGDDKYDENDDYPDFAAKVGEEVAKNPTERRGIVLCGAGVGVDVVANKFKGVRSALVWDANQAYLSRNDDDANVLAIAADFISEKKAKAILEIWLTTPFSSLERHERRIKKINALENN